MQPERPDQALTTSDAGLDAPPSRTCSPRGRWSSRAGWCWRRTRRSSARCTLDGVSLALHLQAGQGGAAALGLSRGHPGRPRARGAGRLGSRRLARRAADGRARRAVRPGHGAAVDRRRPRRRPGRRRAEDEQRAGWIAVLEAEDQLGEPVLLVHADDDRLRDMAVLDVVINNADRKGGHVLPGPRRPRVGLRPRRHLPRGGQAAHRAVGLGRRAAARARTSRRSRRLQRGLGRPGRSELGRCSAAARSWRSAGG